MERIELSVSPEEVGLRLDSYISSKVGSLTRSRVKKLIDEGFVEVNGCAMKASHHISAGEVVVISVPEPVEPEAKPQAIELDIIHEDSDIIVVNKSVDMVVHPAAGHPDGTLVNALLAHCDDLSGIGGELKAGIVHRLDMGTSGVIIAAKNDKAHQSLADQFKNRTVEKIYCALIIGSMSEDAGVYDKAIGRCVKDRKKISSHTNSGRDAKTEWHVQERFGKSLSWVEIVLHTGRTHQIRVHFSEAGYPLVGDPIYGGDKKLKRIVDKGFRDIAAKLDRPALHSWKLSIDHPGSGDRMKFEAPLPADLTSLLDELRNFSL
ncbi:MAG: RluA family pseudouridine synthase [Deltaproteobacteria bacterium]|nr:RluA family pseudouridine synthase [Deltaproteobacteria bacterium]